MFLVFMKSGTHLEIDAVSARRIAVAAQGLHRPRSEAKVTQRHFRRVFKDVGLVQMSGFGTREKSLNLGHMRPQFCLLKRNLSSAGRKVELVKEKHGKVFLNWPTHRENMFVT